MDDINVNNSIESVSSDVRWQDTSQILIQLCTWVSQAPTLLRGKSSILTADTTKHREGRG